MNSLENQFNADMQNIYLIAKKELGYNAINLDGGYLTWSNSPASTTKKEKEYVS